MATKGQEFFDLTGEVALVTGASSGLGRRFAQVLAAHGAKVVLCARREDRLQALAEEIEQAGGAALAVPLDVADQTQIPVAFDKAEGAFGPVTILVNNAGIAAESWILETPPELWTRIRQVNLDAPWFLAQEAARRLVSAGRGGSIINIASVLGERVLKMTAPYAITKAALIQMTKAQALEFAHHGIRVNAIAPGYVRTEINADFLDSEAGQALARRIPQKRIASPEELDAVILLLASSRASGYMTGSVITIDGGISLAV